VLRWGNYNIEEGIKFLEPFVRKCKTLDEFSRTVPRGTVQTDTQSYSRVHNAVMDGQGLGRVFLEHVLQGKSSKRKDNIKVLADNCGSRGFSLFFLLQSCFSVRSLAPIINRK